MNASEPWQAERTAAWLQRLVAKIETDPKRALDALAREELGLNPDDLGSPIGAAV